MLVEFFGNLFFGVMGEVIYKVFFIGGFVVKLFEGVLGEVVFML